MKANNISSQRYRKMSTGFISTGAVIIFLGALIIPIAISADLWETPAMVFIGSCFVVIGGIILAIGIHFHKKSKTAPSEKEIRQRRKAEGDPKALKLIEPEDKMEGAIFSVKGYRGRNLYVFENKCVIQTIKGLDSLTTGNYTDGEKTIYYSDVIGVQFKRADSQVGYMQLETASSQAKNGFNRFVDAFNENSFAFTKSTVSNERMEDIFEFVKKQVETNKSSVSAPTIQPTTTSADEIMKYKELLDLGVITQEEFDTKKKQLLNI